MKEKNGFKAYVLIPLPAGLELHGSRATTDDKGCGSEGTVSKNLVVDRRSAYRTRPGVIWVNKSRRERQEKFIQKQDFREKFEREKRIRPPFWLPTV